MSSMKSFCHRVWLSCIAAVLSIPAYANSGDYYTRDKLYDDSGLWTVAVNIVRKSCHMSMTYEDDTTIEVGGDQSNNGLNYYIMFGNPDWHYREGASYNLRIRYNGYKNWNSEDAVGVQVNAINGVAVEEIVPAVVDEFAGMTRLQLFIEGRNYGAFNLSGTRRGLENMLSCIQEINAGKISIEEIASSYENGGKGQQEAEKPNAEEQKAEDKGPTTSLGTGFFVNTDGYLLTNAHVVDGCESAFVRHNNAGLLSARIVARETTNDLALLKVDQKAEAAAKFRGPPQIRLGDSVVVFGYPRPDFLASTGNLTTGLVSALAGAGDDVTKVQISAPVQSGNSGGPVLDQTGHVVAVVVQKTNQDKDSGEVLQNANFAIKSMLAESFLDANQIKYDTEAPGNELPTPDVAARARDVTVQVMCEVTNGGGE